MTSQANIDRLEVNVVSIVIGALVLIIALIWVEVIKKFVKHTYDCSKRRGFYGTKRKLLGALVVTLLSIAIIWILYHWYESKPRH